MYVLDAECFFELSHMFGDFNLASEFLREGIQNGRIYIIDEVERELRAIDDDWRKWFIAQKVRSIKLDEELQVEVARLLKSNKKIIKLSQWRGQTAIFSIALCKLKKYTYLYPIGRFSKQFEPLGKCLENENIKFIDVAKIPKAG